jgi:hypothetical protein
MLPLSIGDLAQVLDMASPEEFAGENPPARAGGLLGLREESKRIGKFYSPAHLWGQILKLRIGRSPTAFPFTHVMPHTPRNEVDHAVRRDVIHLSVGEAQAKPRLTSIDGDGESLVGSNPF